MTPLIYRLYYFSSSIQHKLKKRINVNGFIILTFLLFSSALGLDSNQSMTYQIFSFLLAIVIVSIVTSLVFRYQFSATRKLPKFGTVGVKLKYRITIDNKSDQTQKGLKILENFADPRPTSQEFFQTAEPREKQRSYIDQKLASYRWLWLCDRQQCGKIKPIDLPTLLPHSKTEIIGEILPTHRGIIRLVSMTIARPDPLGLFNACKTINLPQSLLILPKLYPVPNIQLPGIRKYQSGGVTLASSVGDSEEFRSLREYRPGDSLRKIHWKSWAKIGKPIVKEEQDEFFVRHALILDTFQDFKYSQVLEEAISIAASLACEVQTQDSLLDLMFVGNEAYCFTFGRGISHSDKMLEILASVGACQDKEFATLIPTVMEKISLLSGCICILIAWDEQRKKLVNYLRRMKIGILVLLITDQVDNIEELDIQSIQDELVSLHILKLGQIAQGLMQI